MQRLPFGCAFGDGARLFFWREAYALSFLPNLRVNIGHVDTSVLNCESLSVCDPRHLQRILDDYLETILEDTAFTGFGCIPRLVGEFVGLGTRFAYVPPAQAFQCVVFSLRLCFG